MCVGGNYCVVQKIERPLNLRLLHAMLNREDLLDRSIPAVVHHLRLSTDHSSPFAQHGRYLERFPDGQFRGKLYVFDGRGAVSTNHDVLGSCFYCGRAYDQYEFVVPTPSWLPVCKIVHLRLCGLCGHALLLCTLFLFTHCTLCCVCSALPYHFRVGHSFDNLCFLLCCANKQPQILLDSRVPCVGAQLRRLPRSWTHFVLR